MPNTRKILLISLFLIAVSGLLLHLRIHNFMVPDALSPDFKRFDGTMFLSFLLPLIDVVVVTLLFAYRKTAVYGYLLNGLIVIYGTVLMAHFSIAELTSKAAPAADWFLKSTIPDIGICWGDFFIGKAIYDMDLISLAKN